MEAISLAQGDVRWVFPDLDDPVAVHDALSEASVRMCSLADHLGVRPGNAGSGLEYHRERDVVLAGVFGLVQIEALGISFSAGLYFPRRCLWDLRWGPPWKVDAAVMVSCTAEEDDRGDECGTEIVVEWERFYDVPVDAAHGLTQATAWLYEQGVGEELDSWRARAMPCRHHPVE